MSNFPTSLTDPHITIEECIRAIRLRLAYGHSKEQIAQDLGKHFTQDMLFLGYAAAKILNDNMM